MIIYTKQLGHLKIISKAIVLEELRSCFISGFEGTGVSPTWSLVPWCVKKHGPNRWFKGWLFFLRHLQISKDEFGKSCVTFSRNVGDKFLVTLFKSVPIEGGWLTHGWKADIIYIYIIYILYTITFSFFQATFSEVCFSKISECFGGSGWLLKLISTMKR